MLEIEQYGRASPVEAAGCQLLYLSPYSPDLNPIEQCWSWVKARVRRVREQFDELNDAPDYVQDHGS